MFSGNFFSAKKLNNIKMAEKLFVIGLTNRIQSFV